jgi:cell fate (sporulation/competence/biofilm development) regulator YlbF (YheA/YmcA/DUF963 family)
MNNRVLVRLQISGREKPTKEQIARARELIQETQTDPDWFNFENMTQRQIQDLIDELRREAEGRK